MNTIGFPISTKKNEKRRALLPGDIINSVKNKEALYFEQGYGDILGINDQEYLAAGAHICSRDAVLTCNVICDPKIGDADYLELLDSQTIFGWVHAVQNHDITDKLISRKLTAFAWEDMFYKNRHIFWQNNELAGEAAIIHAFQCYGEMPYNTKVAIIGRGNTGNGALKILTRLGAEVTIFDRKTEALLSEELPNFDVIVNCVLWDTARTDHIISEKDLMRMKRNSLIIDISCDRNGGIETSVPTTIDSPTYIHSGIVHYAVDHTPTLFYKTATASISEQVKNYIDCLVTGTLTDTLINARCIQDGIIIDRRINEFQHRY